MRFRQDCRWSEMGLALDQFRAWAGPNFDATVKNPLTAAAAGDPTQPTTIGNATPRRRGQRTAAAVYSRSKFAT
jgi:hypothetical protein